MSAVEDFTAWEMGAWSDSGDTIWLPRALYSTAMTARKFAMDEWECGFLEVRVLARYVRHCDTHLERRVEQCEKSDPDSMPAWRLESS